MVKIETEESKVIHGYKPSRKLLRRYYLQASIIFVPIMAFLSLILINSIIDGEEDEVVFFIAVSLIITTVALLVLFGIVKLWIDSISYEFTDDEVIVHKGWLTKAVKIVPYRTVTNFHKKRGPFDRLMGIGTIEIETAGRSGSQHGPEEKMEGIIAEEIPNFIATIRSKVISQKGMAAISQDGETDLTSTDNILLEILNQLKEIKKN
ncbi:MAG: PH domain-containing protein [Candidatus Heimdallarchaeota archaeon]|nr:PH domain-containing protein [Candidatus Heimdallarchaeota archaeon]MCK5048221.1 PH domain-containing protein [Candidatus Heimdallarchaeota archaeon]